MLRANAKLAIMPFLENKPAKSLLRFAEGCRYRDLSVWDNERGNRLLYDALASGKPQAIGKLGSTEHFAIRKYLRFSNHPNAEELTRVDREILYTNAGVFPKDYATLEKYAKLMTETVLPEITLMVVWFNLGESSIVRKYAPKATLIGLNSLESYYFQHDRWTKILKGKKVLVMHPFVNTIRSQYRNRHEIWRGRDDVLPDFELFQIAVPHYPALVPPKHDSWFEALEAMKQEMSMLDFDVALIGAGAYSLPLAVHAKKLGKCGIHIGGALQVYFGIRGGRWDNDPFFNKFYNEYWIRPLEEDTPSKNKVIEGGCYW
jgi:hypothetical protein